MGCDGDSDCGRLTNAPQNAQVLMPRTCEHVRLRGKRDVIKDLEMER